MVRKQNFFQRLFSRHLAEGDVIAQTYGSDSVKRVVVSHQTPLGVSGSRNYAGYADEEYLTKLRGRHRADIFDQMRRSDPQIVMCLSAVKNPIRQAVFEVAAADSDAVPNADLHQQFIDHVLFKDPDFSWAQFIEEALTVCDFGHAVFEITHKVVFNHPRFGTFNGIGELGFRSQRTIEKWNLNRESGKLKTVTQMAYGDLDKQIDLPSEFLLVMSVGKEGSNFEGISLLRPAYGSWFRKNVYLKLNAIGIEKFAVPTPVATVPAGQQGGEQFTALIEALENYTTHQTNYLTLPQGWEVDLKTNTYDPQKVEVSIDNEDKRITKAFLANFLELGMSGTGSYALSNDLSDFFLAGIEHIAMKAVEALNNKLIPDLIAMKYGPQAAYPRITVSGISDKAGKEFGELIKSLGDGKWLTPSDDDEDYLRRRLKMPLRSTVGVRDTSPKPTFGGLGEKSLVQRIRLAHARSNGNEQG